VVRRSVFGEHDPIRDRDLFHRFHVFVERRRSVHRIDHGDHPIEPVAHDKIGMRHRGLQHGYRVGEARGLKHHAAKRRPAVVEVAEQLLQRVDEIAAQGAAQAAALQQHHALPDRLDQQVIEPDLAKFVDDHRGLRERGIGDQTVEQGGFSSP
jgi:hypothetical protein